VVSGERREKQREGDEHRSQALHAVRDVCMAGQREVAEIDWESYSRKARTPAGSFYGPPCLFNQRVETMQTFPSRSLNQHRWSRKGNPPLGVKTATYHTDHNVAIATPHRRVYDRCFGVLSMPRMPVRTQLANKINRT
jgi:hypothetical protein